MNKEEISLIDKAYNIAIRDLRSDYGQLGIYAGPRNHHEYWARDSFFASFGSLALGDNGQVLENLKLFKTFQGLDGEIPLRVEERSHPLGLLGINTHYKKPLGKFRSSQPWSTHAIDPTALYIISAKNYFDITKDNSWLKDATTSLEKAGKWILLQMDSKGLISEGYVGNWADNIFKNGNVLYSNVLCFEALKNLSELLRGNLSVQFNKHSLNLKQNIINHFYDEKLKYFVDWIGKSGFVYRDFAPDGNILAIIYGVADLKTSEHILKYISYEHLDTYSLSAPQNIVWWQKLLTNIIFGPYNLNNKFTWWECYLALAKIKVGDIDGAKKDLLDLSKLIVKYDTVYEILDSKARPVHYGIYRSEKAIAWTSGMFVYAYRQLFK